MQLNKILNPAEPEPSEAGPSNPQTIADPSPGDSATGEPSGTRKCRECDQPAATRRTLCRECWRNRNNRLNRVRKEGLKSEKKCVDCKADLEPDDGVRCRECAVKDYDRSKLARDRAKKEGKCYDCKGDLTSDDGIRCSKCAEKHRGYMRTSLERAKEKGICTSCHVNPAKEGMATCEGCLESLRNQAPQQ